MFFLGCFPGSEAKYKNQVNRLHEKNNHTFLVKKLPLMLKSYL